MQQTLKEKGFSIVEILVAAAVFVSAITVFVFSFEFLGGLSDKTADTTQAGVLLEEGAEAVLLLRDQGFDANIAALETETPYYLYWNGSAYATSESEVLIAGRYTRTITIFPAYRNGSDAIAPSGTEDPATRRVRIEVMRDEDGEVLAASEMLIHDTYDE